jgi:hypothetical protein
VIDADEAEAWLVRNLFLRENQDARHPGTATPDSVTFRVADAMETKVPGEPLVGRSIRIR